MKVLHLSSEKTWRGGEQQIAYLIEELSLRGVESIVAVRRDSAFEKYCLENKIKYFPMDFKNEFDLFTAFSLKKLMLQERPDIVHMHTGKGHGIGVLASVLEGGKTPLVLSKRTDFPIKNTYFAKFKFNYIGIKKILCVSNRIKHNISKDLKNPERDTAVYSGVKLDKFHFREEKFFHKLLNLSPEIKLVGNTSAIADQKDYFSFVRVAKKVCESREDVRFLIIGQGPLESRIKAFVKEEGLEEKVLFTGFLSNLPEVLFNLDVFLITSKTEGLGTSILDAFACKIPVVATDAGGIGEIVIEGKTGSLCAIGDVEKLSENVLLRLGDHNLFESEEFVRNFSKENTAERTLAVYHEILG